MNRKFTAGIAFLILLFLTGVIFVFAPKLLPVKTENLNKTSETGKEDSIIDRFRPTPTPFPFNEVTIPYLREKEYASNLGELTKISQHLSYTSYETTYTSDGLKIYGLITKPNGLMPPGGYPGIVFVHGYIPPQSYRTRVNYGQYVDYLAERGFVVFKIDLRGHDRSEGDPGGAYYSGDYVVDTLNAISALENSGFVSKENIGLWGHSMAGNVLFRSLAVKRHFPAVVIWAGVGYTYEDISEYGIDDNSYRPPSQESEVSKKRQRLRDLYGQFDPEHWFWQKVPGTNYLEGVKGNIQLDHAVNDNVVSIEYSRNLVRVLNGTGIDVKINEYNDGGHNLSGSTFSKAMKNTVDFFTSHLRN